MSSARNPGRVVGYWYLLLVLLGPLSLIYVPNKLFVQGDAVIALVNVVNDAGALMVALFS